MVPRSFWVQSGLLTVGCVVAYWGIRQIPVEPCEFLHYGDYVTADGVIEGCGYEETQFFDMAALRFPILARITPLGEVQVGEPTTFKLTLFSTQGRAIRAEDIAVSHTERVHALIVDPSLEDYQHIHPQPAGPPGHYIFEMTPMRGGTYAVYLDFILLTTNRRTLVSTTIDVPGEIYSRSVGGSKSRLGSWDFEMVVEGDRPRVDEDIVLRLDVRHAEGRRFAFQPVMGSYAHLVAFDGGRKGFAHLHPRNPLVHGQDPEAPDLSFSMRLDRAGTYRVWAQIMIEEEEMLIPFDLLVEG
jgi:hypothetical protein